MSFVMRLHENGATGMVAVCDVCGSKVEGQEANVCWHRDYTEQTGHLFSFKITCKEECTEELDRLEGRQNTIQLDAAIGILMNNSGIRYKDMRESMATLWRCGLIQ